VGDTGEVHDRTDAIEQRVPIDCISEVGERRDLGTALQR
jgi:hypothetical protein